MLLSVLICGYVPPFCPYGFLTTYPARRFVVVLFLDTLSFFGGSWHTSLKQIFRLDGHSVFGQQKSRCHTSEKTDMYTTACRP
jgi:hypothetical protein